MTNAVSLAVVVSSLAIRREVLSQCQLQKFPAGWKLELLENNNKELKATWYFISGTTGFARGAQIMNDARFPKIVHITIDGNASILPIVHFRSTAL